MVRIEFCKRTGGREFTIDKALDKAGHTTENRNGTQTGDEFIRKGKKGYNKI